MSICTLLNGITGGGQFIAISSVKPVFKFSCSFENHVAADNSCVINIKKMEIRLFTWYKPNCNHIKGKEDAMSFVP